MTDSGPAWPVRGSKNPTALGAQPLISGNNVFASQWYVEARDDERVGPPAVPPAAHQHAERPEVRPEVLVRFQRPRRGQLALAQRGVPLVAPQRRPRHAVRAALQLPRAREVVAWVRGVGEGVPRRADAHRPQVDGHPRLLVVPAEDPLPAEGVVDHPLRPHLPGEPHARVRDAHRAGLVRVPPRVGAPAGAEVEYKSMREFRAPRSLACKATSGRRGARQ
eukprot:gene2514-biopygen7802